MLAKVRCSLSLGLFSWKLLYTRIYVSGGIIGLSHTLFVHLTKLISYYLIGIPVGLWFLVVKNEDFAIRGIFIGLSAGNLMCVFIWLSYKMVFCNWGKEFQLFRHRQAMKKLEIERLKRSLEAQIDEILSKKEGNEELRANELSFRGIWAALCAACRNCREKISLKSSPKSATLERESEELMNSEYHKMDEESGGLLQAAPPPSHGRSNAKKKRVRCRDCLQFWFCCEFWGHFQKSSNAAWEREKDKERVERFRNARLLPLPSPESNSHGIQSTQSATYVRNRHENENENLTVRSTMHSKDATLTTTLDGVARSPEPESHLSAELNERNEIDNLDLNASE